MEKDVPLFIKIDFREDGHLGAWWSRDERRTGLTTAIDETSIRKVLIALADEIDPEKDLDDKGMERP
jgi:hypothetical protein